jgi:hypothetical protein
LRSRTTNHGLALPGLIRREAAIGAVLTDVGGFHVPSKVCGIEFRRLAFAADRPALHFGCHSLAELMGKHEGALVAYPKVAGKSQHRLPLDLVAEHGDGAKVTA